MIAVSLKVASFLSQGQILVAMTLIRERNAFSSLPESLFLFTALTSIADWPLPFVPVESFIWRPSSTWRLLAQRLRLGLFFFLVWFSSSIRSHPIVQTDHAFRRVNGRTILEKYHVRYLEDFAINLHGRKIFSTIDVVRAFNQIPIKLADFAKTAIITPFELY